MIISLVAAMSENRVIGLDNAMPWHIPEELQYFKKITMGKPIVMGRKTFDAIGRRLLPGRQTIILTKTESLAGTGFMVAHSVADALRAAEPAPELMVVGGATIYQEFLPLAHRLYLSYIPLELAGDAFFPYYDETKWQLISELKYPKFSAKILERVQHRSE
jgi:dihydrofolate reductase